MRKLKANEKIIKEYDKFVLIEVTCDSGAKYRTTIEKWTSKDEQKEVLEDGKKFTKTGYHKAGKEIHKNGKQKGL